MSTQTGTTIIQQLVSIKPSYLLQNTAKKFVLHNMMYVM